MRPRSTEVSSRAIPPPRCCGTWCSTRPSGHLVHRWQARGYGVKLPTLAMQLFRKGFQCAELIHTNRSLTEKAMEWQVPMCVSQVDFARALDNVRHGATQRSTLRRRVPPPVVAAYLRDMRGSELIFVHDGWKTRPIRPSIGLRQGCSLSPLVFRWVMEDAVDSKREAWVRLGLGFKLGEHVLTCLAWADDTWLVAASAEGLNSMIGILKDIAWRTACLQLRPEKCTWAHTPARCRAQHTFNK